MSITQPRPFTAATSKFAYAQAFTISTVRGRRDDAPTPGRGRRRTLSIHRGRSDD